MTTKWSQQFTHGFAFVFKMSLYRQFKKFVLILFKEFNFLFYTEK